MLWVKAFHIIFMVTWFAGLFYLPRLLVYHAGSTDPGERDQFAVMERRLFMIMTVGATLTVVFGLWTLSFAWSAYLQQGWMHAKLVLVAGLIGYHVWCRILMRQLGRGTFRHSQKWLRFFNEVPSLFLIAIVILAVVKPF